MTRQQMETRINKEIEFPKSTNNMADTDLIAYYNECFTTLPNTITVYHGSDKPLSIEDIQLPGFRKSCDFGQGFYLTNNKYIAEEWVASKPLPIVNQYTLDLAGLKHIENEEWLNVVLAHRQNIRDVIYKHNLIKGKIADDRLFPTLSRYMEGDITRVTKLDKTMRDIQRKHGNSGLYVDEIEIRGDTLYV